LLATTDAVDSRAQSQVAQLEVERMAHELHAAHEHRDALLLRLRESDSAREQVRRLSPVKRKSLKR
jgi:hypothetical protein